MTRRQLEELERRVRLIRGSSTAVTGLVFPTGDGAYRLEVVTHNGQRQAGNYATLEAAQQAFDEQAAPDAALIYIDV